MFFAILRTRLKSLLFLRYRWSFSRFIYLFNVKYCVAMVADTKSLQITGDTWNQYPDNLKFYIAVRLLFYGILRRIDW
jgi:hypothetical protein